MQLPLSVCKKPPQSALLRTVVDAVSVDVLSAHPQKPHNHSNNSKRVFKYKIMDLNVEFCDETHVIEVALADTVEDMRRKVASAVGLPEDSFCMSFGDEAMGEGADMTQLSAGDTILVTTTKRCEAIAALHALGETDLTPERLKEVEDPEVACLLLQAEVATVIPCWFLAETSIPRLDLSAVSTVTRIEADFLRGCMSLTSVDLTSFNILTHVESSFLQNCSNLKAVDLTSLKSLEYVGGAFLYECSGLTVLNLSSLKNLTHVGNCFLYGCTSLTAVDLSSFNSLTHVGDNFLQQCTSLISLDLSSLNSLKHIRSFFLSECRSLTAVDLSSLNSLTHVGEGFLQECSSLTALDVSSFKNIAHVGDCFLNGCASLTALDLSSLSSLECIGASFLKRCSGLTSVDLSSLSSVKHIDQRGFCYGLADTLQTIHLSGCSAVVSSAVEEAGLSDFVVQACPKRKRDESPEEDCKRPRLSQ